LGRIENNNDEEEINVKIRSPGNIYVEDVGNYATEGYATCHIE
jgi:hypothetical protein